MKKQKVDTFIFYDIKNDSIFDLSDDEACVMFAMILTHTLGFNTKVICVGVL
jgi:hypothetical protein